MAQVTGTYSTYDQVGINEDLAQVITNIAPVEVPFQSNIGSGTCDNTLYEWQEDTLAAASSANAVIEGDETSFSAPTATVRLSNRTQISKKSVIVTGTARAVNTAGRADELPYQVAKQGRELKRDMEASLTANLAVVAGNDSTARVTGGIVAWIKTNESAAATGLAPIYTSQPTGTRSDGTTRAFTEAMLKTVVKAVWTQGGSTSLLMVGGSNKQTVSSFAGIAALRHNVTGTGTTMIVGAADVYVSDFGNMAVVPNRFQRASDALVIDPDYASVEYLRPFQMEELAKTGDAEKRHIIVEYGLKVLTEKAHGIVADLTS
jgi:hypothetical protein